ncbi:hypothetical protein BKA83DRAFT_3177323 [Pisolithus microcarpus]|nr:hypothetical protein BKA83DRAFT_3177323 [Pisolithus microcarpus]
MIDWLKSRFTTVVVLLLYWDLLAEMGTSSQSILATSRLHIIYSSSAVFTIQAAASGRAELSFRARLGSRLGL